MKNPIVCLFGTIILMASCDTAELKVNFDNQDYDQAKEGLWKKEAKDPVSFLKVTGTRKRNLVGQTVVKGNLINMATLAVFKDVNVELKFYSKTGALLETNNETFYEIIHPGESKDFKTKYFAPKGTDSVALKVVAAKSTP
ncbi:MAG: hypothetical protein ABIR81_12015 [Ginsengibacter sp.]